MKTGAITASSFFPLDQDSLEGLILAGGASHLQII